MEADQNQMLVEKIACTCEKYLSTYRRDDSEERWSRTLHSLMLQGKLRTALCCITGCEKGGVLQPRNTCKNTGEPVLVLIRDKHPEDHVPSAHIFDACSGRPSDLLPFNLTEDTVIEVAPHLSGGAGPGGTDVVILKHWVIRFGEVSGDLRQIVAEFSKWLVKKQPSWAVYCALMSGHLISFNNHPGVRPVGVGKPGYN